MVWWHVERGEAAGMAPHPNGAVSHYRLERPEKGAALGRVGGHGLAEVTGLGVMVRKHMGCADVVERACVSLCAPPGGAAQGELRDRCGTGRRDILRM